MCLKCHQNISDEQMISSIENSLRNVNFHKYNVTSVNHLYLTLSGVNGPKAQILAGTLLEKFLEWCSENHIQEVDYLSGLMLCIVLCKW